MPSAKKRRTAKDADGPTDTVTSGTNDPPVGTPIIGTYEELEQAVKEQKEAGATVSLLEMAQKVTDSMAVDPGCGVDALDAVHELSDKVFPGYVVEASVLLELPPTFPRASVNEASADKRIFPTEGGKPKLTTNKTRDENVDEPGKNYPDKDAHEGSYNIKRPADKDIKVEGENNKTVVALRAKPMKPRDIINSKRKVKGEEEYEATAKELMDALGIVSRRRGVGGSRRTR